MGPEHASLSGIIDLNIQSGQFKYLCGTFLALKLVNLMATNDWQLLNPIKVLIK